MRKRDGKMSESAGQELMKIERAELLRLLVAQEVRSELPPAQPAKHASRVRQPRP